MRDPLPRYSQTWLWQNSTLPRPTLGFTERSQPNLGSHPSINASKHYDPLRPILSMYSVLADPVPCLCAYVLRSLVVQYDFLHFSTKCLFSLIKFGICRKTSALTTVLFFTIETYITFWGMSLCWILLPVRWCEAPK